MSLLKALSDPAYWEEVANQSRNFGQATSNAVAQVATAPVDLINMGLGFAGLGSKRPVGGTEWLKELGLYRDVPQGAAQVAGETLGNVLPVAIPAKASQIAGGLLKAIANASKPATMGGQRGAVVWHGSPHKFDKFDASKIGTGEGGQVYGRGLYFSESQEAANAYRDALSKSTIFVNGAPYLGGLPKTEDMAIKSIASQGYDKSVKAASQMIIDGADEKWVNNYLQALNNYKNTPIQSQSGGSLYKVDLPDEAIARMLNWSSPINHHNSEILNALEKAGINSQSSAKAGTMAQDQADYLSKHGIVGIKYLEKDGAKNYVVFPGKEGLLSILSRNGVPIK